MNADKRLGPLAERSNVGVWNHLTKKAQVREGAVPLWLQESSVFVCYNYDAFFLKRLLIELEVAEARRVNRHVHAADMETRGVDATTKCGIGDVNLLVTVQRVRIIVEAKRELRAQHVAVDAILQMLLQLLLALVLHALLAPRHTRLRHGAVHVAALGKDRVDRLCGR